MIDAYESVSIVMPAYNAEKYINYAVNSVLRQSYENYELIIVDDCSTDGTYKIMEEKAAEDSRIRIFKNKENSGVSKTRNYAVRVARGKWIAFLDSDDMWAEDKLEKQMELMRKNPEAVLSYTASAFTNENNQMFDYILPVCEKIDYKTLLKKNLISCSSVIVKKDVIAEEKMQGDNMHEDYSAWLNIVKKYGYAVGINEPLLIYRLSQNSKSGNRLKSARMSYNSYRYVGYSHIVSFLLILRYSLYSIKKRLNIYKSKK